MIYGALTRPPRFLTADEVLTLHAAAIERFGGTLGVRDEGLLDSALAMPKQAFGGQFAHPIPFGMGSAYAFHLCKNHPFIDGNKRVALAACLVFLRMNGWEVLSNEDETVERVLAIAEGRLDKSGFEEWLVVHAKARPSVELRDFFEAMDYRKLSTMFSAIAAGPVPERVATILEAAEAIPAIHAANGGAISAESSGDAQAAMILHHHTMLLTALFRVAEVDMGYEW